jgi:hypothetical protein
MSDPKKDRAIVRALLEFCEDVEPSASEIEEDLRAEGVDIEAFLARVDARVGEVKEEERLSRLRAAREKLRSHKVRPRTHRYDDWDHGALVAELARRQAAQPQAGAFHRNFEKMTDDDLRTLLEDQDETEEG